ncbi:hypothetical protein BDP55DRAFT_625830 [Colletotrichum godetiae]|uniref:Uncharacterized protein n=1 Tax=Colletotrichum godetiae TaxID=1209918 RepID=A0AAJ0EYK2_9PEZI|nr:uncharacterized protein BDP55DRAFT_625830 [Colletotrichum godetiae]KAK1700227.1 hypothetical protein BDP55DRAFT_625830 [Colletotrichum godetiae]
MRFHLAPAVCVSLDFGLHRWVSVDDHLIRPPSDVTPSSSNGCAAESSRGPTPLLPSLDTGHPTDGEASRKSEKPRGMFRVTEVVVGFAGIEAVKVRYLAAASKMNLCNRYLWTKNASQLSLGFGEGAVGLWVRVRWSVGLLAAYRRPAPI